MFTLTFVLTVYDSARWAHSSEDFRNGFASGLCMYTPPTATALEVYLCNGERVVHAIRTWTDGRGAMGDWVVVTQQVAGASVCTQGAEQQLRLFS